MGVCFDQCVSCCMGVIHMKLSTNVGIQPAPTTTNISLVPYKIFSHITDRKIYKSYCIVFWKNRIKKTTTIHHVTQHASVCFRIRNRCAWQMEFVAASWGHSNTNSNEDSPSDIYIYRHCHTEWSKYSTCNDFQLPRSLESNKHTNQLWQVQYANGKSICVHFNLPRAFN